MPLPPPLAAGGNYRSTERTDAIVYLAGDVLTGPNGPITATLTRIAPLISDLLPRL